MMMLVIHTNIKIYFEIITFLGIKKPHKQQNVCADDFIQFVYSET